MVEKACCFIAHVKAIAPECISSHCSHLLGKKIRSTLKVVLGEGVKMLNFVNPRPLSSRIFSAFCDETGRTYTVLLLHTEV
jgi:hypothetical protein